MADRVRQPRSSIADWTTANPIIPDGMIVTERDPLGILPSKFKVGDGVRRYLELPYASEGPEGKDAYSVALGNGFAGTLSEWLLSLKGDKGDMSTVASLSATSITSHSLDTPPPASKTLTIQTGKDYVAGMSVVIASAAAPSVDYMWGKVSSYSGNTLIVDIDAVNGSGTHADWVISFSAGVPLGPGHNQAAHGDKVPQLFITENFLPIRASAAIFLTVGGAAGHILAATKRYLYKSTDNGQTWGTAPLVDFGEDVWRVKLFEASNGYLYYSVHGGTTPLSSEAAAGIWRSTNGGTSWSRVIGPATSTMSASAYSNKVWALNAYCVPTVRNQRVYKVTTAGTTTAEPVWPMVPGSTVTQNGTVFTCVGVLDLGIGNTAWDFSEAVNGHLFVTIYTLGVYFRATVLLRSTDGGITWADVTTHIMNVPMRSHGHVISIAADGVMYMSLAENQISKTARAATTYSVNQFVTNPANAAQMFRCLRGGTTTGAAPTWVTTAVGAQTNDTGGVVWEYVGNLNFTTGDAWVMKSINNGADWTVDFGYSASQLDGDPAPTGEIAGTEILPIGTNGELLMCLERKGWGDIYRRDTNGTYTRVWHKSQPVSNNGQFNPEPMNPTVSPVRPTDYAFFNSLGMGIFSNGAIIVTLGHGEGGYLISLDNGLTFEERQLQPTNSSGGIFYASNIYNDRMLCCYRVDIGELGYWNNTADWSYLVAIDGNDRAQGFSVQPLPAEQIPKGVFHDHADGAGAKIPLAGLAADAIAAMGGGSWVAGATAGEIYYSGGNVGIGAADPISALHIKKDNDTPIVIERSQNTTAVTYNNCVSLYNPDTTPGNYLSLAFSSKDSIGDDYIGSQILGYFPDHTNGSEDGTLSILTTTNGTRAERVQVSGAGINVIGTVECDALKIDHATAVDGYVWTATDADGNGQWEPPAGVSSGLTVSVKSAAFNASSGNQYICSGNAPYNATLADWTAGSLHVAFSVDSRAGATVTIVSGNISADCPVLNAGESVQLVWSDSTAGTAMWQLEDAYTLTGTETQATILAKLDDASDTALVLEAVTDSVDKLVIKNTDTENTFKIIGDGTVSLYDASAVPAVVGQWSPAKKSILIGSTGADVLIQGASTPTTKSIRIGSDTNDFVQGVLLEQHSSATYRAPNIVTLKSNGTEAAPTAIAAGSALFLLDVNAYVGSYGYADSGWLKFVNNGTVNNSSFGCPTDFIIGLGNGSTGTEKLRIQSNGTQLHNTYIRELNHSHTYAANDTFETIATIALAAGEMIGGHIDYVMYASNTTPDLQVHRGRCTFAAYNKGGVYGSQINMIHDAGDVNQASTGTITDAFQITTGASLINIQAKINSSLGGTVTRFCNFQLRLMDNNVITPA